MENLADNVANKFSEVENKVSDNLNNELEADNFLFFIKTNEIDENGVCGLEQKLTVKIISVIALFSACCAFISALGKSSFLSLLWNICVSVFFLIVAFYTFYSTINLKHIYANIGYVVYSILWIINFIEIACETLYYLFKFFYPFSDYFFRPKILAYIFCEWLGLILYLYFLWIVFCFTINLKNGRIA